MEFNDRTTRVLVNWLFANLLIYLRILWNASHRSVASFCSMEQQTDESLVNTNWIARNSGGGWQWTGANAIFEFIYIYFRFPRNDASFKPSSSAKNATWFYSLIIPPTVFLRHSDCFSLQCAFWKLWECLLFNGLVCHRCRISCTLQRNWISACVWELTHVESSKGGIQRTNTGILVTVFAIKHILQFASDLHWGFPSDALNQFTLIGASILPWCKHFEHKLWNYTGSVRITFKPQTFRGAEKYGCEFKPSRKCTQLISTWRSHRSNSKISNYWTCLANLRIVSSIIVFQYSIQSKQVVEAMR